jgi:PKD repeat protein
MDFATRSLSARRPARQEWRTSRVLFKEPETSPAFTQNDFEEHSEHLLPRHDSGTQPLHGDTQKHVILLVADPAIMTFPVRNDLWLLWRLLPMKKRHAVVGLLALLLLGVGLWLLLRHSSSSPPSAVFSITPEAGDAPLEVRVDGASSVAAGATIADYRWDFGDGGTGTGPALTHHYPTPGKYTIRLTVTSSRGETNTASKDINVTGTVTASLGTIEPADGAVVRGTEAWVRWWAPEDDQGRLFWRPVGEQDFREVKAVEGQPYLARLSPLEPGKKYEYRIESRDGDRVLRSGLRSVVAETGLTFEAAKEHVIQRDYDQTVLLTLRNGSADKVRVAARSLARLDDLPADIVGPGSVEQPADVAAGGTLTLRLAVTAADAMEEAYEIPIEAAGAYTAARVKVAKPRFKLSFRVLEEDTATLTKTIEIQNEGQTLADLGLTIAKPNAAEVRLQPDARHAYLPEGKSLTVTAVPVLYLEFESLQAELECEAAGQTVRFPLEFRAPARKQLVGWRGGSGFWSNIKDFFCTNKPNTCSLGQGNGGSGPQTPKPDDGSAAGNKVAATAITMVGKPYDTNHTAPSGPDRFDCSGLIRFSLQSNNFPDPSENGNGPGCKRIADNLPTVSEKNARPGDIMIFNYQDGNGIAHCAIVTEVKDGVATSIVHATTHGVKNQSPDSPSGMGGSYRKFGIGFYRPQFTPSPGDCGKPSSCSKK